VDGDDGVPDDCSPTAVDISGCPDAAKVEWFEYLATRDRLVAAYAEQSNVA
jgi:hypothetical protein